MRDRFQLLGVVGRGGFGKVFHARFEGDGGFEKEVALKVLHLAQRNDEDFAARLRDEARLLGLLRHRAIVQVDRLIKFGENWVVVMEYVDGFDLHNALRAARVPAVALLEILVEVASAIDAAWERPGPRGQPLRLMHRDLKPSNIRLTGWGDVKVLDFGIAHADFDSREAITGTKAMGSPPYMAPERFRFEDTPTSDVYSLGTVAFEALTRRRFGQTRPDEAYHRAKVRAALGYLRSETGVDERVIQLVASMLAWSPTDRPSPRGVEDTCRALLRDIDGEALRHWAVRVRDSLPAGVKPLDATVGLTLWAERNEEGVLRLQGDPASRLLDFDAPEPPPNRPDLGAETATSLDLNEAAVEPRKRDLTIALTLGGLLAASLLLGLAAWLSLPQ